MACSRFDSKRQMDDASERVTRAAKRAAFHLLRASLETLRAVEAVIVELRREPGEPPPAVERIEVE